MKLRKLKNIKYNLLNSELINIKFYLGINKFFVLFFNNKYMRGFRNQFSIFEIIYIKSFLKKNLKLIYKFHINNQKILFIGFKDVNKWTKFKVLFFKSKHYIISNFWLNGFLINRSEISKFFFKKLKKNSIKDFNEIFFTKKTPDLIVSVSNSSFETPYQEIFKIKIPSIFFLKNVSEKNCFNYQLLGNLTSNKSKIFIYLLLKSVLTLSLKNVVKKKNL